MANYDKSKYEVLVPKKEMNAFLRILLYLPIVALARWGAREINTYEDKMEELIDLKNSYIEELQNPKLSDAKLEIMKSRISYLETSDHFDRSPSKGMWMILGAFAIAGIWGEIERRKKKENQAAHTTPASAPR
ncbi:hypothetical protein [Pelagicoccus sp. SDUM812002]|uniref:hypothetical protein n=1 Tax=Pelagicoccus sp. SDUM812002 TaxID=3041266 RepID=UPI00280FAFD0|nr:hypothetical protein [Pelagicoccus sp. SDUM812002]MDQ8188569.1 hypothetical protein [Pelagicoccus sp. SDUM812002]